MNDYGWGGGRKEEAKEIPRQAVEIDGAGGLV